MNIHRVFGLRWGKSILLLVSLIGFVEFSRAAVVFNNVPATLDLSYVSHAYQANETTVLGNYVQLTTNSTARYLTSVTVTMVTQAKATNWAALYNSNNAGWSQNLTAVIYSVDNTGAAPVLNYVVSQTQNFLVPWKPLDDPYNGYAFNATFTFDGSVTIPSQLVIGLTFNTQNYGFDPTGVSGPYNSLNVAIDPAVPTVGSDLDPSHVYIDNATVSTLNGTVDGSPLFKVEATGYFYETWIASYGYTVGAAGALRDDDPDHDGLSNLTEFAFGTDPTRYDHSPITITKTSSTEVTISYLARNDGSVSYEPLLNENLQSGSWSAANGTRTVPSVSGNYDTVQYVYSTGVNRKFFKVQATEVP